MVCNLPFRVSSYRRHQTLHQLIATAHPFIQSTAATMAAAPAQITVEPEELARRYLDGASLDDLGVLCGCTATRIRCILVAHSVEIRPRGHNHGNDRSTKLVRR
jgi:hypothetical protein